MQKQTRKARVLAIVFFSFLFFAGAVIPGFAADATPPAEYRNLIGRYENSNERFLIREREGQLELLYDTAGKAGENPFLTYVTYPLRLKVSDYWQLLQYGPSHKEIASVKFERDSMGRGIAGVIAAKTYRRQFFDAEEGRTFQIKALWPAEKLRQDAMKAQPPFEQGIFFTPDLVEVTGLEPTIRLDIRYATTRNFMGIQLYEAAKAFLQRPAAEALTRVQKELKKYGYGLIVYDAYRPWYVTKMFWDATPDSQKMFVADPAKGSRHNRGGAVDIGLYSLQTGEVMDMGSDYDEFSMRAYPTYPGGTTEQRNRRDILRILMEGEGFTVYPEEWWHFDYGDWRKYPILNLRFDEIK